MKKPVVSILILSLCIIVYGQSENDVNRVLPVMWEELTSPDFVRAVGESGGTCIIPLGIIEKHGPHLPLGTDLIDIREIVLRAAKEEYVVVFPSFYFGEIFEARQQPGTVAYSPETVWNVLQETCDEIHRNGINKIILVNGHGGNNNLLPYFCQAQLQKQKDYAVFLFNPDESGEFQDQVKKLKKTVNDGHAGEEETSMMLTHRPDLVHLDRANDQSGDDLGRLNNLLYAYTAIWWYARYPNHYAGDGSYGTIELGNLIMDQAVSQLVEMIRSVKADQTVIELQNKFYEDTKNPLNTKQ
jgi:creatinine amidohydrolase